MKLKDLLLEAESKKSKQPTKVEFFELPYKDTALAPSLSKENVDFHYGTLTKAYAEKYNNTQDQFQYAGFFLHDHWWHQLQAPKTTNNPKGKSKELIDSKFKTFKDFKDEFEKEALTIHGSGWCYLSKTGEIKTIKNHEVKNDIALLIDFWEHSYQNVYGSDKSAYLKAVWKIINWDFINSKLD